jgi:hypothetical protein
MTMFKPGIRRTLCRTHFNKRMNQIKMMRWRENPQERQAKIVWQVAYIDSVKIFKQKIFCKLFKLGTSRTKE